jgi:hypothetical protein
MVQALERAKAALEQALGATPPKTLPKEDNAPKSRKRRLPRAPNGTLRQTVLDIVKDQPATVVSEVIRTAKSNKYPYKLDPLEVSRTLRGLLDEKIFSRAKNGARWEYTYNHKP